MSYDVEISQDVYHNVTGLTCRMKSLMSKLVVESDQLSFHHSSALYILPRSDVA
jgi:hypothetical protein